MANIKLITHSSVLIQDGSSFILTDPWFEKPAFGSWLPTPPTSIHPVYLLALANSNSNFNIVVSHGHDDHLDDDFLSLFPKSTNITIPKYISKGLYKRIERLGFTNINEVDTSGEVLGNFTIKSYINMEISRDDAILTIEGSDFFIVHANDNWQELVGENLEKLKCDTRKFNSNKILYMSQCNLADGWPNIYRSYSEMEKQEIHSKRVDNIISNGLLNADKLGAAYFLNYAGYAAAYVKGKDRLKNIASYTTNLHLNKIRDKFKRNVEVLKMLPGDSFDFSNIHNQFSSISLDNDVLKNQSYKFYEKYDRIKKCDSYREYRSLSESQIEEGLSAFLIGFKDFVETRVYKLNFNVDILGCKIVFSCSDLDVRSEIIVGKEEQLDGRVIEFVTSSSMFSEIILKSINWENLYIGYGSEVIATPKNANMRSVVRWLAMYGYFYQRRKVIDERR